MLYARFVSIFGQPYLAELGFNPMEDSQHIPIDVVDFRGLQFALGRFGLKGVRILSCGGSYSSWLGESTFAWIGTIHGNDLRSLVVLHDVGISFEGSLLFLSFSIFSPSLRRNTLGACY